MSTRMRTVPQTHREAGRGAVNRSNRELSDTRHGRVKTVMHALFWGMRGCFVAPNEMRAKALECEHKARATPRSGRDTHDTELATNGASWPTK
jgi:hypothetical protein